MVEDDVEEEDEVTQINTLVIPPYEIPLERSVVNFEAFDELFDDVRHRVS